MFKTLFTPSFVCYLFRMHLHKWILILGVNLVKGLLHKTDNGYDDQEPNTKHCSLELMFWIHLQDICLSMYLIWMGGGWSFLLDCINCPSRRLCSLRSCLRNADNSLITVRFSSKTQWKCIVQGLCILQLWWLQYRLWCDLPVALISFLRAGTGGECGADTERICLRKNRKIVIILCKVPIYMCSSWTKWPLKYRNWLFVIWK